jgi:uncharacterized protein
MAKKKSCPNHYRFVANCPDCRSLNSDLESNDEPPRKLYSDANEERNEEVPYNQDPSLNRGGTGPEIPRSERHPRDPNNSRRPQRYYYQRHPKPSKKKGIIIALILIVIIGLIVGLYSIPLWKAKINLQQQLYEGKSDVDFWMIYSLNYWSTNFFFNKIGLIGALIGSAIMSIPPEDTLLNFLAKKFGWKKPSKTKSLIFWWTGGFALFFIIGQAMDTGTFALAMYMIEVGTLQSDNYLHAMVILNDPTQVSMIDMFIYRSIVLPIINYVLALIIFRICISIFYNVYFKKKLGMVIGNICLLVSSFFALGLFGMVLQSIDGIDLIRIYSTYIGLFGFLIIGIIFNIASMMDKNIELNFDSAAKKKSIIMVVVTSIIILIPVFISIPTSIGVNSNPDDWKQYEWDIETTKEIEWTRLAAGIEINSEDKFIIHDIHDYPENTTISDLEMINNIRQYDKNVSGKIMVKDIKTTHETMADSDIIYIKNGSGQGEYWVSPKTLEVDKLQESNVNLHTELYDHVEGFIALDTSTGEIVDKADYEAIFGVNYSYPIFFGEREDTSYLGSESDIFDTFGEINAYENDILLNTGWESNSTKYNSTPDGTLTGMEALWYTLDMGLTEQALDGTEKSFLINRNIKTRVQSVLYPGMQIDNDPYLVFNAGTKTMYYALSIYTNIKIGAYAKSPLLRFLGVALIDVKTGELSWYKNPNLPLKQNDPLSPLYSLFTGDATYPWVTKTPQWLLDQLRYPESLWESQIGVDYTYHVTDANTWKRGNDIYERPHGGDVFYIETDIGDGLEFIGVELVEYIGEGALKLAGLYMIRHGEHFGETIFYRTDKVQDNLIGPETARLQFDATATQELNLIAKKRFGNRLLYPLGGSLYYYIPVYSATEDYEVLVMAGFVNAFTKSVYWGQNVSGAYDNLKLAQLLNDTAPTNTTPIDNMKLDITGLNKVEYNSTNGAEFRALLEYINTNDTLARANLTLNVSIRADVNMTVKMFNANKTGFIYDITDTIIGYNYTIGQWIGANALYPGEGRIVTIKINPQNAFNSPELAVGYKFDLIQDGKLISSSGWSTLIYLNPT